MEFPDEFLQFPNIVDKLNQFHLFRTGVKISVRINTTGFVGGSILITPLPCYNQGGSQAFRHSHYLQLASSNSYVLSAGSGETCEFTVPYAYPNQFFRLKEIGTGIRGGLCSLYISCLTPLASAVAASVPILTVSVFAELVDTHVSGLQPGSTLSARQIFDPHSEQKTKSVDGLLGGVPQDTSNGFAQFTSLVDGFASTADSLSKLAKPFMELAAFNKPMSLTVPTQTYNAQDQAYNYGKGLDNCSKLTIDPEAELTMSPNSRWPGPTQHQITKLAQTPSIRDNWFFDGTKFPDDILATYDVHPMAVPTAMLNGINSFFPTHQAYWTSFFKYWRGGTKFRFHFFCSKFVSTRVRISWFPDKTNVINLAPYSGDLFSKVIDIQGDTIVDLTVPYLSEFYWSLAKETGSSGPSTYNNYSGIFVNGAISVSLVSAVQTPQATGSTRISCVLWQSAAEDYQLADFVGTDQGILNLYSDDVDAREKLIFDPHSSIRDDFSKPFPGLVPIHASMEHGLVSIEKSEPIQTYLKRYVQVAYSTSPIIQDDWVAQGPSLTTDDAARMIIPFIAWAGGLRWKQYIYTKPPNITASYNGWPLANNTHAPINRALFPADGIVCTTEQPWYDMVAWRETLNTQGNLSNPVMVAPYNGLYFVPVVGPLLTDVHRSVADDFGLGMLAAPPPVRVPGELNLKGKAPVHKREPKSTA